MLKRSALRNFVEKCIFILSTRFRASSFAWCAMWSAHFTNSSSTPSLCEPHAKQSPQFSTHTPGFSAGGECFRWSLLPSHCYLVGEVFLYLFYHPQHTHTLWMWYFLPSILELFEPWTWNSSHPALGSCHSSQVNRECIILVFGFPLTCSPGPWPLLVLKKTLNWMTFYCIMFLETFKKGGGMGELGCNYRW